MTADQVRKAREALGMTQEEFARTLHVERNTVVRWENRRHPVSPSRAALIRLTVDRLLADRSQPVPA